MAAEPRLHIRRGFSIHQISVASLIAHFFLQCQSCSYFSRAFKNPPKTGWSSLSPSVSIGSGDRFRLIVSPRDRFSTQSVPNAFSLCPRYDSSRFCILFSVINFLVSHASSAIIGYFQGYFPSSITRKPRRTSSFSSRIRGGFDELT